MLLVFGECQKNYYHAVQIFVKRINVQKSHIILLRLEQRLENTGCLL